MRHVRGLVRGAALVSLLVLASPAARPDVEETELRLKTAGVEPGLRRRIHDAIDRGAKYLMAHQERDGQFHDRVYDDPAYGVTALCSLALAHAGGAGPRAAAQRGLELIAPGENSVQTSTLAMTYAAGLAAMLLTTMHERPAVCRKIAQVLADEGMEPSGWWGYSTQKDAALSFQDLANLSTTQYAALGIWAGCRESGLVRRRVWWMHLRSMCRTQTQDGSWSYLANAQGAYPNGTFMGLASVVLGRRALAEELEDDPVTAAQAAVAMRRGLRALDRDARVVIDAERIDYYGYYALEKACTFADAEELRGFRWYVAGAERLLAEQHQSGNWGGGKMSVGGIGVARTRNEGDLVATSYALLFLLRSSETFHPVTPRDVDVPGPTTPGGDAPGPQAGAAPGDGPDAPPPPPVPVPLSRATDAVARLEAWIELLSPKDPPALEAIDEVARGLLRLEADPAPADAPPATLLAWEQEFLGAAAAWRERAGRALVLAAADRSPAVALAAVRALEHGPKSAGEGLRKAVASRIRPSAPQDAPRKYVDAAFGSLAALGEPASMPWLASQVSADRDALDVRCARAAMAALARFDGGHGPARRAAAIRIVRAFADVERRAAAADPEDAASWADAEHWRTTGGAALAALEALCRDPETGERAADGNGVPPATVAEFGAWLETPRRRR